MNGAQPKDFDAYAHGRPPAVRKRLAEMRETVRNAAPEATETISYGMPALRLDRMLVAFGAFQRHIGFFPGSKAIAAFANEISGYKSAKGSVQFPYDEPLPRELIARMVRFTVTAAVAKSARARGTAARGPAARTTAPRPQRRPT
ncbi:MAG TPA: DUF1801 domain-containing protein [Candidatus Elarobacter sp.]